MKRLSYWFSIFLALGLFVSPKSYASVAISPSINIHTTVLNPQTNSYVDSLGLTDTMYHPGDTVVFHVTISNTGEATQSVATVDNTLPDFVTYESGAGNLNASKKILTFIITNIYSKTTREYAVVGKVADSNALPTNQGIVCVADKAIVKTTDGNSQSSSASFCIQKNSQVLNPSSQTVYPANTGLTKTPPTGPEALPIISVLLSGLGGLGLRKISRK